MLRSKLTLDLLGVMSRRDFYAQYAILFFEHHQVP